MDSSLRSEWQTLRLVPRHLPCVRGGIGEWGQAVECRWCERGESVGVQAVDKGGIGVRGALAVREWSGVECRQASVAGVSERHSGFGNYYIWLQNATDVDMGVLI